MTSLARKAAQIMGDLLMRNTCDSESMVVPAGLALEVVRAMY